jgi:hypothetical protein
LHLFCFRCTCFAFVALLLPLLHTFFASFAFAALLLLSLHFILLL